MDMKKLFVWAMILFIGVHSGFSQGYEIALSISGYESSQACLGYYWGDKKIVVDTAEVTGKSGLVFRGSNPLPGGLYFILLSDNVSFNFFVDGITNKFSIKTAVPELQKKLKVSGFKDNDVYLDYLSAVEKMEQKYTGNKPAFEAAAIAYIANISEKYPDMLTTKYLRMLYTPKPHGEEFKYFDFSDARILRTDLYWQKISFYIENSTRAYKDQDYQTRSACYFLDNLSGNEEIFKHTSTWLINDFDSRNDVVSESVYNALVKKYYIQANRAWITPASREKILQSIDNKQFDIANVSNSLPLMEAYTSDFPSGIHREEAQLRIEEFKFAQARQQNTQEAFRKYMAGYPAGRFVRTAESSIDSIVYAAAKSSRNIGSLNAYLAKYPKGRFRQNALGDIEDISFRDAAAANTFASYTQFTNAYPGSRYKQQVDQKVEELQYREAKRLNTEAAYKSFLANNPSGVFNTQARQDMDKIYEKERRAALLEASKTGIVSLNAFADKYPGTKEAEIARNSVNRFNIEHNTLEKKIYITERLLVGMEGDRDFMNDVFEDSRNTVSGGKHFNLFALTTLQNRTEQSIKLKVEVHLNLINISNISIFYNVSNDYQIQYYFLELKPGEKQSLLVLFRNVGEGFSIGKALGDHSIAGSLYSIGKETQIDGNKPLDVILFEETGPLPVPALMRQEKLIRDVVANHGNIIVNNKSQYDRVNQWISSLTGSTSDDKAYLSIYFTKKTNLKETLEIYDDKNKRVASDEFSTSGLKSPKYLLDPDKNYTVAIPGCSKKMPVFVKKKITHLIVKEDCTFTINKEDQLK